MKWLSVIQWRGLLLHLLLHLLALMHLVDHVDGHLVGPNCQIGIKAMARDCP